MEGQDNYAEDYHYNWNFQKNFTELDAFVADVTTQSFGVESIIPSLNDFLGNHQGFIIAEAITCVLTAAGNLAVIFCFICNKRLLIPHNYHILSLSVADTFVGAVGLPLYIWSFSTGLPKNVLGCVWANLLVVMLTVVSTFAMLVVTIDRYLAVVRPGFYVALHSPRLSLLMVIVSWGLGIAVSVPPGLGWNSGTLHSSGLCFGWLTIPAAFFYMITIATIIVPITIMVFIYIVIFRTLRRQNELLNSGESNETTLSVRRRTSRQRRHIRRARCSALIVATFAICWLPLFIINVARMITKYQLLPFEVLLSAVVISHVNSAVNPVIYAISLHDVRKTLKILLLCRNRTRTRKMAHMVRGNDPVTVGGGTVSPAVTMSSAQLQFKPGPSAHPPAPLNTNNLHSSSTTPSSVESKTLKGSFTKSSVPIQSKRRPHLAVLFWDDIDDDPSEVVENKEPIESNTETVELEQMIQVERLYLGKGKDPRQPKNPTIHLQDSENIKKEVTSA